MRDSLKPILVSALLSALTAGSVSGQTASTGRSCRVGQVNVTADTVLRELEKGPPTFRPIRESGAPRYPVDLRQEQVNGSVETSFTVDSLGSVVPGSEVVERETDIRFGNAVCEFLRRARFTPFAANSRRYSVRLVSQPFTFEIR